MSAHIQSFLGSYDYAIDEKGRLSIPAKYRKVMTQLEQDTFILSALEPNCLTLFPYSTWQESIIGKLDGMPQVTGDASEVRRLLGLNTTDVNMDGQGRIMIPSYFCQHAKIEKAVKIIGCTNRIELWSPDEFQQYSQGPDAQSLKDVLQRLRI